MSKKDKKNKKFSKTGADPRLAAPHPTANSPEFVPLTGENVNSFGTNSSGDVYDFIPELKDEHKYH